MRMLIVGIVLLGLVEDTFCQTVFDAGLRLAAAAAADGVNVIASVDGDFGDLEYCHVPPDVLEVGAAVALQEHGISGSSESSALLSIAAHIFPQHPADCAASMVLNLWVVVNPTTELLVLAATGSQLLSGLAGPHAIGLMNSVREQVSVIATALRRVRDNRDGER